MATSKSFIKANSQTELAGQQADRKLDRLDSLRGSVSDVMAEDTFGPLSNVRYASSAFCACTLYANLKYNIQAVQLFGEFSPGLVWYNCVDFVIRLL
jgi:hypothetical protein